MSKNVVTLKGFDEFARDLKKLSTAARSEKMQDAMEAGAHVIQAHMQNNIREKLNKHPTGNLANSITVKREGKSILVGSFGVVYARIQEFGGIIVARAKPYLTFQIDGKWFSKKSVNIPARPWARPVIDNNLEEVKAAIVATLRGLLGLR